MKPKTPIEINGEIMWKCSRCNAAKPSEMFYNSKTSSNGIGSHCKDCHNEVYRNTRNEDLARKRARDYSKRLKRERPEVYAHRLRKRMLIKDDPEKVSARSRLNLAVRRGDLQRPGKCSKCGSNSKTHAHHDDYSKPLEVIWLCTLCHGKTHQKITCKLKKP